MRSGNQNNTQQPSVSDQKRYEFSNDPRAWKPTRKEEWIFAEKTKEEKQAEAAEYLNSDAFFAEWDLFCAKLDNLSESLGLSTPQAQVRQLSTVIQTSQAA